MTLEGGIQQSSKKLWLRHVGSVRWARKPHLTWSYTALDWQIWERDASSPTLDRLSNHGRHYKWRHSCWNHQFPAWKHEDYINLVPWGYSFRGWVPHLLYKTNIRLISFTHFNNILRPAKSRLGRLFNHQVTHSNVVCDPIDAKHVEKKKRTIVYIRRFSGPVLHIPLLCENPSKCVRCYP